MSKDPKKLHAPGDSSQPPTQKQDPTALEYLVGVFEAKGLSLFIEDATHLTVKDSSQPDEIQQMIAETLEAEARPRRISRQWETGPLRRDDQQTQKMGAHVMASNDSLSRGPVASDDQETRRLRLPKAVQVSPLPEPVLFIEPVYHDEASATAPTVQRIPFVRTDLEQDTSESHLVLLPRSPTTRRVFTPHSMPSEPTGYHPLCQALLVLVTAFVLFLVQGC